MLAVAPALLAGTAEAGVVETHQFDLPGQMLSIFGLQYTADYLGPPVGTIVETRAELTFDTGPSFDAADIILTFQAPSRGVPVWQFSGADLGWSGQGTFDASLATHDLDGAIDLGDPPPDFSLFFLAIHAAGFQPLGGQFIDSYFAVDVAPPCTDPADVDGSGSIDGADLVAVILAWGPCPGFPAVCPEDVDGSGTVDGSDLVAVILAWGSC